MSRRTNIRALIIVLAATAISLWTLSRAEARIMSMRSYQQLFDKSDLVAIANPTARTADSGEESTLPDISAVGQNGTSPVKCAGVQTPFAVSVVLKGDQRIRTFVLRHCRLADTVPTMNGPILMMANGPGLVFFDPADQKMSGSYLLFLVRESDGLYAPTLGQTDPNYMAITRLPQSDAMTQRR